MFFVGFRFKEEFLFGKRVVLPNYKDFVFLFNEIFLENTYIFKTDAEQPLIVDVGSNIGISAVYFKIVCPGCRLVCFEPSTSSFEYLQKNVSGYENVKIYNLALSNYNGDAFFSDKDGSFNNKIVKSKADDSIKVSVKKASDAMCEFEKIDF